MLNKSFISWQILVIFAISPCVMGGQAKTPKAVVHKAGSGEAVKSWGAQSYATLQKGGKKPYCVYIYDFKAKNNMVAKDLEEKFLAAAEVKNELKDFVCLKIKSDGTDAKDWPKTILANGYNGAAFMLISSDLKKIFLVNKDSLPSMTSLDIAENAKKFLSYEAKLPQVSIASLPEKKPVVEPPSVRNLIAPPDPGDRNGKNNPNPDPKKDPTIPPILDNE